MRQYRRFLACMGMIVGAWVLWQAPTVLADEAVYPYAGKPCIWAPYTASGTQANWCPDYDWGDVREDESAHNVLSPYGYYYRNCTDYTAWKVSARGVTPSLYTGLGNAKDWAVRAAAKGLRVDNVPAPGAVAVRTTGVYGHTAFVEAVDGAGGIVVSQFNYRGDGNYSVMHGTPVGLGFVAFIHFEDSIPMPAVQPPVAPVETTPPAEPAPIAEEPVEQVAELPEASAVESLEPVAAATDAGEVFAAEETPSPPLAEEIAVPAEDSAVTLASAELPAAVAPAVTEPLPAETESAPVASVGMSGAARPAALPPEWRQASASPPVRALSAAHDNLYAAEVAAPVSAPVPLTYSYWPLAGLIVVVCLRETALRRVRLQ